MKFLFKMRREITKGLSKISYKKTRLDYLGVNIKIPVFFGLGSGYFIPEELWMGECLKVFLQQKKGVVIDIGANVGIYLVKLRVLDKNRQYFGFEPNQICCYYCRELIKMNDFKNSDIFSVALSDEMGVTTLYTKDLADKGGSIHRFTKGDDEKLENTFNTIVMKGDTLVKMLNPEKISVIKIDVEGAELEVIRGLEETIDKYKPILYFEMLSLPEESDRNYQEVRRRREGVFNKLSGMDYIIMGKTERGYIKKIDVLEDLDNDFAEDYISSHKNESNELYDLMSSLS